MNSYLSRSVTSLETQYRVILPMNFHRETISSSSCLWKLVVMHDEYAAALHQQCIIILGTEHLYVHRVWLIILP